MVEQEVHWMQQKRLSWKWSRTKASHHQAQTTSISITTRHSLTSNTETMSANQTLVRRITIALKKVGNQFKSWSKVDLRSLGNQDKDQRWHEVKWWKSWMRRKKRSLSLSRQLTTQDAPAMKRQAALRSQMSLRLAKDHMFSPLHKSSKTRVPNWMLESQVLSLTSKTLWVKTLTVKKGHNISHLNSKLISITIQITRTWMELTCTTNRKDPNRFKTIRIKQQHTEKEEPRLDKALNIHLSEPE